MGNLSHIVIITFAGKDLPHAEPEGKAAIGFGEVPEDLAPTKEVPTTKAI